LSHRPIPGTEMLRVPTGADHARAIVEFKWDGLSFLTRMARDYGDIAQVRLGLEKFFEVAHPDYIRYALVFGHHNYMKAHAYQSMKLFLGNALLVSEGEVHRRHRREVRLLPLRRRAARVHR
jgi:cytochrome P450